VVEGGDLREHLIHRAGPLAPLLGPVLAVELADTPESAALTGEERVSASRELMLDLLAADRDRSGSLVVLLEDAHWFDSGSWGLVHDAAALPDVAVVVTARPADEDTERELADNPGAATLALAPLGRSEIRELALARLGAPDLDEEAELLLVETCKGNPFFTVEVVQTLAERGALAVEAGRARLVAPEAFQVPRTIQAAISARIDDLAPDEQLTLKVASVIGSPFTGDLLAEIHPTGRRREPLLDDLRSLAARELVVPDDEGSWRFNHALTRDVAYGLMVRGQRRGLHAALAVHYEALGDDLDHLFPVLAHHWLHAEDRDKAVSYLTRAAVSSLAHGMPRESVAQGVQAARLLGVDLETDPARIRELLPGELAEIERLMAGRRPADLGGLPPLVDAEIGAGMGIVLRSMPSAHQSLQTELFALMAVRNLNLTLRFGAGPLVPGVYAMYSIVLHGLGGDAAVAYEFSELARTVDATGGNALEAVVDFIHVWFNNHWFNPVLSGVHVALEGAEAGLSGPDPLYGSFNLAAATTLLAVGGRPLEEVIAAGEAHLARIGPRSATASFHNRLEAQMAKALAGHTDSLTSLTDPVTGEEELAAMAETANYNQAAYYYIAKLRLAYLAGDVRSAVRYAELAEGLLPSFGAQVGQGELAVLSALARLADLPAEPVLRAPALEDVREQLAELQGWAARCAANFEHKATLVRGELAAATGDWDAADSLLGTAAEQAAEAGFPQWAALACERRGHAARAAGRAGASRCFEEAADHYRAWGAHRKAAEAATEPALTTPA
jgi:predicted ATPase